MRPINQMQHARQCSNGSTVLVSATAVQCTVVFAADHSQQQLADSKQGVWQQLVVVV